MAEQIVPAERASEHLLAIRRRWWLVVAGAVIAGALAFTVSSHEQKRYDASAKVLLSNTEPVNLLLHSTAAPSLDPERDLNTDVALVKLDSVALRVRAQLKLPLTATQLLDEVRVAPQGASNLVAITARDLSPRRAAAIANAFAVRYIHVRQNQAQTAYRQAAQLAQRQVASLSMAQQQGAQGATLRQQLHQLQAAGALQTGGAQLVDPASVPTSAASPRPKFAAGVGVFGGLLLGALAAIAAGATDRRRLTALEAVPVAKTSGNGGVADSEERERLEHPFLAQPQSTRAVSD
jgi:succinoglycan biosynthesis transport protein ExoP